mmetsp:Transcript_20804/g.49207  ORF Transcript_20804/g.49207 Transcript_20804/m.49207 type:complete len:512 (+) Transcript_20804:236-1771(+)
MMKAGCCVFIVDGVLLLLLLLLLGLRRRSRTGGGYPSAGRSKRLSLSHPLWHRLSPRGGRLRLLVSRNEGVVAVSVDDAGALSEVLEVDLLVALVGFVGDDPVVSVLPADDLVAPISDLVAEGLHGQDREGFLHLRGQLLDPEQKQGDHGGGGDHPDVVPGRLEGLVQGQRHEEQPEGQKPGRVAVVDQRDGGGQQTLAGSQVVLEDGQGLVHLVLSHEVHGEVLDGHGEIEQRAVGPVGRVDDGVRLGFRQSLVQLQPEGGLVLPLRREVALHGPNEGPGADRQPLEVGLALLRGDVRGVVEGVAHADQVARVVDVHPPVLSRLVPSLVGRVGAEDQQETEGSAGESERVHGKGHTRNVVAVDEGGVVDLVQVVVSDREHVPEEDDRGDRGGGGDLSSYVLVDTGIEDCDDVADETVGASVLNPVVVGVNGPPELAGCFSVRDVLCGRVGGTGGKCRRRDPRNVVEVRGRGGGLGGLRHEGVGGRQLQGEGEKGGGEFHGGRFRLKCRES